MVFHILNEKKAQVNIEFIVAVVLLAFVIVSVIIITIQTFPAFTDQTKDSNARAKAAAVENLLLYSPGIPQNWSGINPPSAGTVVILGLAYFDNRSNQTVYGALDPQKLAFINSSSLLNYSFAKSSLNLTGADFYLDIQSHWGNLTYYNYTPTSSQRVVSITKKMPLINNSFKINQTTANVTLLVWES